ncbi:MAG TPA: S8 family serine peptidase [Solimonas sp.]|nr:S8 family serine peptidase [Solimonas sp.]
MNRVSLPGLRACGLSLVVSLLAACGSSSAPEGLSAGGGVPPPPPVPSAACAPADAQSEARFSALGDTELLEVIVSFDGTAPLSAQRIGLLEKVGVQGKRFSRLPIAGVLATRAQIEQLKALPGVRSVRWNAPLSHEDDVARYLTSVDQAFAAPEIRNGAGEPITGKGVAILVNDSGIDATHPDLLFGDKTIQNALGHTNLRQLAGTANSLVFDEDDYDETAPFTPIENVPNSDVLGSHGTHVAGIAAGNGTMSGGRFAGAARGASLIGYGSGATLLVLDTLGGFDYALQILDEHPEYNLRIVTNSFGNTGDIGTCFDPADPTNIATKMLADRGVVVVFSAGNSGSFPGTITGNFKKAPWVLAAGNGEKNGLLAPSSSRGSLRTEVYQVTVDGETFTVEDRPTVVTPGTDYISTRAIAADPFAPLDTQADVDAGDIPPQMLPFYTHKTGTSMAAPHLAGLTALLLEANPALTWREVKQIFKQTATNMPGYATWEVGSGFANVEAALAQALALRSNYGLTNHTQRGFHAALPLAEATEEIFVMDFLPAGTPSDQTFEVDADTGLVIAQWSQPLGDPCTCAVALVDPAGRRYGSSIALPLLGSNVGVVANGMPGTWTLQVRGIGSVSGVALDPLGVTNGVAGPSTLDVRVTRVAKGDPRGLRDVGNHPQRAFIEFAVEQRLMDGLPGGFSPNALLSRGQFAEYLMAWGVRQTRSHNGERRFSDLGNDALQAAAEAVTRSGQLILSRSTSSLPLLRVTGNSFSPSVAVSRQEAAYALVQAMGREEQAKAHGDAALTAPQAEGDPLPVADAAEVDPALRGHIQEALNFGILDYSVKNGRAVIAPRAPLSRADFAQMSAEAYADTPFPF